MTLLRGLVVRLLPGVLFLAFWQYASGRLIRPIYVSRPTDVAARTVEMFASGEIQPHLLVTLQELLLGYALGVSAGIVAGYALGRAPRAAAIWSSGRAPPYRLVMALPPSASITLMPRT